MKTLHGWVQFKHIRTRIAVVFLSVVVILQLAGLVPMKFSLTHHANKIAENQIEIGERIFVSLIQHNTQSYKQAAQVLAADYAFREAVASADIETIESALTNYQSRIHAAVAYYVSEDGAMVVSTANSQEAYRKVDLKQASQQFNSGKLKFDIIDGKPFQLISVPVKAPVVIGWIVLGFKVDNNLANQVKQLTNLDVTFIQKTPQKSWQLVSGTLSAESGNTLIHAISGIYREQLSIHSIEMDDKEYHLKMRSLYEGANGESLMVVLQGSVTRFVEDLNMLFLTMLLLTLVGIGLLAAVIWYIARKLVQPITELADNVSEMTQGNYDHEIQINRSDELGHLGKLFNDMREAIQQRTRRIHRLAFNDELTGLSNRLAFMQGIGSAILAHGESKDKFSVIVININRFKPINNTLGRDFGDDLLRHVGQVLKENIYADHDMVARLDADEFAVLLYHADQTRATAYAARINAVFDQPVHVQGQAIDVRTGIGIAVYPEHGMDEESLLNHAETAQQESKAKKTDWIVYNAALEIDQSETLTLISDLKEAISQNQLLLYIQPKIDVATRKALGGEALIRWVHPEKGMIFPDQFIPFAEQTGVISDITNWMLNRACEVLAEYKRQGLQMSLAVNLSTRDLNNIELPEQLAMLLAQFGLDTGSLKLEITEGSLMQDPERAETVVRKLAGMGLHLSIDDFGTGYSSLAYLRQLPVQELKIDRSFVMFMDKNVSDASIVKSTIDLAHNLGLRVVAEGIENEGVLGQLAKLGCDEGQGYFIGKPMPEKDFSVWLERWEGQDQVEINVDIGDDMRFAANPLDPVPDEKSTFKLNS